MAQHIHALPPIENALRTLGFIERVDHVRIRSLPLAKQTAEIISHVRAFQEWHALPVTGEVDRATSRALGLTPGCIRYCDLPDIIPTASGQLCRWEDKDDITWGLGTTSGLRGITRDEALEGFRWVMRQWESVCGIKTREVNSQREADIFAVVGRIDRGGNTLAWSELPCGPDRSLDQKYDSMETWSAGVSPQRNTIGWWLVVLHEVGHALGLPHIPPRDAVAVLNPIYNPALTELQMMDAKWAQDRYGPAVAPPPVPIPPPPPPVDPPPPPPSESIVLEVGGARLILPPTGDATLQLKMKRVSGQDNGQNWPDPFAG